MFVKKFSFYLKRWDEKNIVKYFENVLSILKYLKYFNAHLIYKLKKCKQSFFFQLKYLHTIKMRYSFSNVKVIFFKTYSPLPCANYSSKCVRFQLENN